MNRDLFIDAIGNLPDDIIYNVDRFETKKKVKNRKLIKYGSLAAGLLLIFTVGIIIILGRPKDDQKNNSISSLAGGYMINGIRYQLIENMADRVIYDDYDKLYNASDLIVTGRFIDDATQKTSIMYNEFYDKEVIYDGVSTNMFEIYKTVKGDAGSKQISISQRYCIDEENKRLITFSDMTPMVKDSEWVYFLRYDEKDGVYWTVGDYTGRYPLDASITMEQIESGLYTREKYGVYDVALFKANYKNYSSVRDTILVADDNMMREITENAKNIGNVDEAEIDILAFVHEYFPEYNTETMKIDVEKGVSGSPLEYYQYTIYDYIDDIQVNRAHINFSYDGQLIFVQGSHNKIDRSKDYDKIDENKALDIAYSYLIEEKDRNDDGLSWNYIILDTSEDMNVQCAEKMVYRTDEDTVAWMVELILKTEEGEKDSMFNPLVHIYIDAAEGKVLNMNYTDGE